jgi:hypothetical protein
VFTVGLAIALTGFSVAALILTNGGFPAWLILPLAFGPFLIPKLVRAIRDAA